MSSNNNGKMNNDINVSETLAMAFGRPHDTQHSYKTMTAYSHNNFSIIAKVVNYLKDRHLHKDSDPLTIEEILEAENLEITTRTKNWLVNEVLEHNPRVKVIKPEDGQGPTKYLFNPTIDVKDRKGLRNYLMDIYQRGEGAIWKSEILESVPSANKVIDWLVKNEHIVVLTRPVDKREIVCYNEGKQENKIDDEFIKLWRSISVEGVADDKIEEYLEKHGIQSIQDLASKKMEPIQKRRKTRKMPKNFKKQNVHMEGILEDYADK